MTNHKPQLEDGYTRIANEWLEAFIQYPAPGSLKDFVLLVARYTWGYHEKWRQIPVQTFQDILQVSRRRIYQLRVQANLFNLIEFNEGSPGESAEYRIQKDYIDWLEYRTKAKWTYEQRSSREERTTVESEGRASQTTEERTSPLKERKESTTKENDLLSLVTTSTSNPPRNSLKSETAKQRKQRKLAEEQQLLAEFDGEEQELLDDYMAAADEDLKTGTTVGGRVARLKALIVVANEVDDPDAFRYGLHQANQARAANPNYVKKAALSRKDRI